MNKVIYALLLAATCCTTGFYAQDRIKIQEAKKMYLEILENFATKAEKIDFLNDVIRTRLGLDGLTKEEKEAARELKKALIQKSV